ncbi:TPA: hypothetical protein QCK11_002521 [Enterobacter asburiae]|nr:hypothetical protein [Enterobacter asburiae]
MSANELALKFSTAPAEHMIGVLPVLEVKEALREEVEDDVMTEVWQEHQFEIEATEERVSEAESRAEEHEEAADNLATAIMQAIALLHDCEAKDILSDAIEDNAGYGRKPL